MKKLIERIKEFFRKDELPQDISNNLEYTRKVYDFIQLDENGDHYIPIPKEIYNQGENVINDWNDSIRKTINIHSYLSALELKERWKQRGYNLVLNPEDLEYTLMEGNDYILN